MTVWLTQFAQDDVFESIVNCFEGHDAVVVTTSSSGAIVAQNKILRRIDENARRGSDCRSRIRQEPHATPQPASVLVARATPSVRSADNRER